MMKRLLSWTAVCCAFLVLVIASTPAQADIGDDLYAYWNMDGNLDDAVDANHGGTLMGASGAPVANFVAGKFGQAIDIDRADSQYVEIGGDENDFDFFHGDISVSAWFTVEAWDQNWQALIAKGEGDSWRIARRSGSNVMAYAGGSGDIPGDDTTGPDVSGGDWHHVVAITENEVSTRLWVDGGLVATGDAPTLDDDVDRGTLPLMIGGNPDTGGDGNGAFRSWNGSIDDVAIWTRTITDDEVGHLWNGGAGNAVPEPSSMILAAVGLLVLGLYGWLRRK